MFFYRRRRGNLKVLFVLIFVMLGFKEIASAITDFGACTKTPVEYSSVDVWQIESGMFIEGDIPYNYGAFEGKYRQTSDSKASGDGQIYLIPIGNMYMGFQTKTSGKSALLNGQSEATYRKISRESTESPESVHFIGKVVAMTNEDERYAREYLAKIGVSSSEISNVLRPYKLMEWDDFYSSASNARKELGIGCICFAFVVLLLWSRIQSIFEHRKNEEKKQAYFNMLSFSGKENWLEGDQPPEPEPAKIWPDPFSMVEENPVESKGFDDSDNISANEENSTGLKLKL